MTRTLLGLAMAAAMLGATAAHADWNERGGERHWRSRGRHHAVPVQPTFQHQHQYQYQYQYQQPQPQQGRWELQTVQRWVDGSYQQTWVEPVCVGRRHWQRCTAGGYQNVWVPGRYEDRQEWVWIAWPAPSGARLHATIRF